MRSLTSLTVEDAWRLIESSVDRYNTVRLRSAIAHVTPQDMPGNDCSPAISRSARGAPARTSPLPRKLSFIEPDPLRAIAIVAKGGAIPPTIGNGKTASPRNQ